MTNEHGLVVIPDNLEAASEKAWRSAQPTTGFLGGNEARFMGMLAAGVPAQGAIVEIGSIKGKSTVMLATVASHYVLGPVVAIDPHTPPPATDQPLQPGRQRLRNSWRRCGMPESQNA